MGKKKLLFLTLLAIAVVAFSLLYLVRGNDNENPQENEENEENYQPPWKPLWGVPEENMVEFLKAAEKENLYWKYDGITHISFFPRFYELVEEYGGRWEDENGQIHGRQKSPLPALSETDENDPRKYGYLLTDQLKWRGIKSRVHPPRNMELRTEGGPTYYVTTFNLYNIHLVLENGEWFEAGFGRTQPGYWDFQDPVRLYCWHGWGARPYTQSEWGCLGLNENETRQREISLEVEIYESGGKNWAKMGASSYVQNPDGSWTYEHGMGAVWDMNWDGPLPSGTFDSTQEQAGYPINGFTLWQDAPYAKHFSYFVKDNLGNPWYQVDQGNFSSVITKTGADPPMEMSYDFEGASETLYMNTRCRFQHDIDFITLYQVNINVDLYLESGYRGGINSVRLYGRWEDYGGTITDNHEFWSGTTPTWVNVNTGIARLFAPTEVFRLDLWNTNWENIEEWTTIASFTVTKGILEIRYMEIPMEWAGATPEERVKLEIEFMEIPMQWAGAPS
ncbi:hypothetical protein ES703_01592 [subsurface metagenome]